MDADKIAVLQAHPFYPYDLKPIRGRRSARGTFPSEDWAIVGYDSEYNATLNLPICSQLWCEGRGELYPGGFTLTQIALRGHLLAEHRRRVLLATYFSPAELSQLLSPFWLEPDVEIRQVHPNGVYNVQGDVFCEDCHHKFRYLVYDVWHFCVDYPGGSSLRNVARALGLSDKLTYDVTDLRLAALKDPQFRAYAIHDAELSAQVYRRVSEAYEGLEKISVIRYPTPASAAQAAFRCNYLRGPVAAPPMSVRALALRANWAGRVEAGYCGFQTGAHEHDADSLYPRSCLTLGGLPQGNQWYSGRAIPADLSTALLPDGLGGFADVTYAFPDDEEWPCLPVWTGTRLLFPSAGRSYCTLAELAVAIERGVRIEHVHEAAWYRQGARREFRDFLTRALKGKTESTDPVMRGVYKQLMNSSIGKFIQNKGGMNYRNLATIVKLALDADEDLVELWARRELHSSQHPELSDLPVSDTVRLGGSWCPEWHTLILGRARAALAQAVYASKSYPQVLMLSTDAIVGLSEIEPVVEGVPFPHKYGPADYRGIRGRFYGLFQPQTDHPVKVAHHAFPGEPGYPARLLLEWDPTKVNVAKDLAGYYTLGEALRGQGVYRSGKQRTVHLSLRPEPKRRMDGTGWTHPWYNVEAHNEQYV